MKEKVIIVLCCIFLIAWIGYFGIYLSPKSEVIVRSCEENTFKIVHHAKGGDYITVCQGGQWK